MLLLVFCGWFPMTRSLFQDVDHRFVARIDLSSDSRWQDRKSTADANIISVLCLVSVGASLLLPVVISELQRFDRRAEDLRWHHQEGGYSTENPTLAKVFGSKYLRDFRRVMTYILTFGPARLPALSEESQKSQGQPRAFSGFRFLLQFLNPPLEELPLRFLLGQRQRFLIRSPSFSRPVQPAVHIGTSGMRQVVIRQSAMLQHCLDMGQTHLWTIAHGDSHGAIEKHHRRRLNSHQLVVKRNNLSPVGGGGRFRLGMNGSNRSLQCVRTEAAGFQGSLYQCHSLVDLFAVPERAVLVFQQNQLSRRRGPRTAT